MSRARMRSGPIDAPGAGSGAVCHPEQCSRADDTLAPGMVAWAGQPGAESRGYRTLSATEAAVSERLASMTLDMSAMAAVSNLYRAAGAIRNHFERTVLAPYNLTWTGWVVLWVVWIWKEIEARHVAAEAGISKGTLTGVAGTLERRSLLRRCPHPDDARRVLMYLTPSGHQLVAELFSLFNQQEAQVVAPLSTNEVQVLAAALRKVVVGLEDGDDRRA